MLVEIRFTEPAMPHPHLLQSKVHFDGFQEGEQKNCLIQKMTCGRYSVMSWFGSPFYKVFKDRDEVENSFYEVID